MSKHNDTKNQNDARIDLAAIKTNVVDLANDIKEAGAEQARAAAGYVQDRVDELSDTAAAKTRTWERRIAKKPLQYVAGAVAVGWIAKMILGRRS